MIPSRKSAWSLGFWLQQKGCAEMLAWPWHSIGHHPASSVPPPSGYVRHSVLEAVRHAWWWQRRADSGTSFKHLMLDVTGLLDTKLAPPNRRITEMVCPRFLSRSLNVGPAGLTGLRGGDVSPVITSNGGGDEGGVWNDISGVINSWTSACMAKRFVNTHWPRVD